MNISASVKNKVVTLVTPASIVCGNSDYTITFTFDNEWSAEAIKTARFVYRKGGENKWEDVAFNGNTVKVPVLSDITMVLVGVYAGELRTTTPAIISCERSILCGGGTHDEPPENIYNQILAAVNELIGLTGNHPNLKNNPHGVTIAQIGAAPSGYGLGSATKNVTSWNDAKVCGWYRANGGTPNGYYWIGFVTTNGTSIVQHIYYPVSGANWQCIRSSADSGTTWGEWEYVNPPMKLGEEYRTTERHNGKAVYTKLVEFGNLPNATYGSVRIGVDESQVIGVNGLVKSNQFAEPFPPISSETGTAQLSWWLSGVELNVKTLIDMSNYTATVIIKYTKD